MNVGVCLCLIVRDEEHCIDNLLSCYTGSIDALAVVDTGSKDNTVQIIEDYIESTGITGRVEHKVWRNFETGRNQALEHALSVIRSAMNVYPTGPLTPEEVSNSNVKKIWYIHIMDADNMIYSGPPICVSDDDVENRKIVFPKVNIREKITNKISEGKNDLPIQFSLKIATSFSIYGYTSLLVSDISGSKGHRWYLPLHEYVGTFGWGGRCDSIEDCYVFCGHHGARSKSSVKFLKDVTMLQEAINECWIDPDDKPRAIYYLAQSYKDARLYDQAIEKYRERVQMKYGTYYERYLSHTSIAELIHFSNEYKHLPEEYKNYLSLMEKLKAMELDPHRKDVHRDVLDFFRKRGLNLSAWNLLRGLSVDGQAMTQDFTSHNGHDHLYYEELALSAYYAKDHVGCRTFLIKSLSHPKLDERAKSRILTHFKWLSPELQDVPKELL